MGARSQTWLNIGDCTAMIDPIAGWRVASDDYEYQNGMLYKRRRRSNLASYAYAAMVIAMPIATVAVILMW